METQKHTELPINIPSCSILKKESKLTFENVPTMSWIQSTEISGELLFSLLRDLSLEIQRDFLHKMVGPMLACDC